MNNNNVDIFASATPDGGTFFKFANVGDSVQGTYISKRQGVDSYGNNQTIYIIKDAAGKIWNVAFRLASKVIHDSMKEVSFGQIVGFKYDESRPSKARPGSMAKIIRVYADPKFIDHEWIKEQQALGANLDALKSISSGKVEGSGDEDYDEDGGTKEGYANEEFFNSLDPNAKPLSSGMPQDNAPKNEALDAIRSLAKTKGLVKEGMSVEEGDAAISNYAGLPLTEENYTTIIIKLTGYTG